jgi:nucleotide-binding universal stress UspA family protein
MNQIRKILVPTDFSDHADEALRVAHTLARATGAEVILFHVAHAPAVVSEGGQCLANPSQGNSANLWDRFQDIVPSDSKVRVKHEVIVADQLSVKHILEILDKLGCDLIVMGMHGRSRLKRLLFGSLAAEVVRRARCPVMLVKAVGGEAALPALQVPHQVTLRFPNRWAMRGRRSGRRTIVVTSGFDRDRSRRAKSRQSSGGPKTGT